MVIVPHPVPLEVRQLHFSARRFAQQLRKRHGAAVELLLHELSLSPAHLRRRCGSVPHLTSLGNSPGDQQMSGAALPRPRPAATPFLTSTV